MRTRLIAPPLTQQEAATVARFDAAPDEPESLRERVAAAICAADGGKYITDAPWFLEANAAYRRLADAAIAVMRGDDA